MDSHDCDLDIASGSLDVKTEMDCAGTSQDTSDKSLAPEETQGSSTSNNEPEEECSVCRNEMVDRTILSDCIHQFCYECITGWLTKGSGLFCPMCKTPVKYIRRIGTETKIDVNVILAQKEPVAVAAENLITEKRIVSRKMRSCRRMMNKIDELISICKYQKRREELERCKQRCVAQLNSMQMLRDDIDNGAVKALVVSKVSFRRLVYERQVIADRSMIALPSKTAFLENIEHYRSVINSFLSIELKAIPVREQPQIDSEGSWYFDTLIDFYEGKEEFFINRIFDLITERGISQLSMADIDNLFEGRLSTRVINIFISELHSLISSGKTYLEWCGSVRYRSNNDGGGESHGQEVVTVDDSIEIEPEPTREFLPRRHFNLFQGGIPQPHSSLNYRESSSDTDQEDDEIYFQAPLRMRDSLRVLGEPSAFQPVQQTGHFWSDLTSPSRLIQSNTENDSVPKPPNGSRFSQRKETKKTRSSSFDEDDDNYDDDSDGIQVVDADGTIVLDDSTDQPGTSTHKSPTKRETRSMTTRKRKSDEVISADIKKSKSSLPEGLVRDVKALLDRHSIRDRDALNVMVAAVQTALHEKKIRPNDKPFHRPEDSKSLAELLGERESLPSFQRYIKQHNLSAPSTKPKSPSDDDYLNI